jgi:hypothetical protein
MKYTTHQKMFHVKDVDISKSVNYTSNQQLSVQTPNGLNLLSIQWES